jgi:hypothetical protein
MTWHSTVNAAMTLMTIWTMPISECMVNKAVTKRLVRGARSGQNWRCSMGDLADRSDIVINETGIAVQAAADKL